MIRRIAPRVLPISCSTGVPAIGKKRIRCSGGGSGVTSLIRRSSVWLVRSPCAHTHPRRCCCSSSSMSRFVAFGGKKKPPGVPGGFGVRLRCLAYAIASPSAERCENAKYAKNQEREIMAANVARRLRPRVNPKQETERMDRRKCCRQAPSAASPRSPAAPAARPARARPAARAPCSASPSRCCRSSARATCFRCGGSIASAATTPRMRARWGRTRTASRRSSSRSRAMRSSSSRRARPPTIPTRPLTKNYHYEIELVAALDKGGRNVSDRAGARPRLRLHDRPRHDPARPAAGDGRREEAVGDRQELRPLGADRADPPGGAGRPLHQGRDHARRSTARSSRTPT